MSKYSLKLASLLHYKTLHTIRNENGITIIAAERVRFTNVRIDQQDELVFIICNGKVLEFNGIQNNSSGNIKIGGGKSKGMAFEVYNIKKAQIKCSASTSPDA